MKNLPQGLKQKISNLQCDPNTFYLTELWKAIEAKHRHDYPSQLQLILAVGDYMKSPFSTELIHDKANPYYEALVSLSLNVAHSQMAALTAMANIHRLNEINNKENQQ